MEMTLGDENGFSLAYKISEQSPAPENVSSFLEMDVFKKLITSKALNTEDLSPYPHTGMSVITFSTNLHIFQYLSAQECSQRS
jgi:redox-sensitive bicupin YhaK (pirin superfamily)